MNMHKGIYKHQQLYSNIIKSMFYNKYLSNAVGKYFGMSYEIENEKINTVIQTL